jgi:hypothetical protein
MNQKNQLVNSFISKFLSTKLNYADKITILKDKSSKLNKQY